MPQPNPNPRFKVFRVAGPLVLAVALTACATHYFDEAQRPRWETVLKKNKDELTRIAIDTGAGRYEVDKEGRVSVQLRASEVIAVERRREFVFFTLKSGWIDDPFQSLVFDLDSNRPSTKAVRELFTLLDRPVYHVQYIKDGWYYCEYN